MTLQMAAPIPKIPKPVFQSSRLHLGAEAYQFIVCHECVDPRTILSHRRSGRRCSHHIPGRSAPLTKCFLETAGEM